MSSYRLVPKLSLMRDWVQKSLENIRVHKLYEICEFNTETNTEELTDTSQQFFMINFVNTCYQLLKSQQQRIHLLEERLSELENTKIKTI